jgi:hypothetical protein
LGPRDLDADVHVATSSVKDWSELIGRAKAGITPRGGVCVDAARRARSEERRRHRQRSSLAHHFNDMLAAGYLDGPAAVLAAPGTQRRR